MNSCTYTLVHPSVSLLHEEVRASGDHCDDSEDLKAESSCPTACDLIVKPRSLLNEIDCFLL